MSDTIPLPPRPNLDRYRKLAKELQQACKSGDPAAIRAWATRVFEALVRLRRVEITPRVQGEIDRETARIERRWHELESTNERARRCLLADAQFFVARGHGFASWPKFAAHVERLTLTGSPVANFEAAVDAIVRGDSAPLRKLLHGHPELARARSTREHRSTLLHYVSANGVEDFRQKTPKNIVEITKMLLDAGAEVDAESDAYGGGSTTLGLVATSIHPEKAGVQIELMELLLDRGARIDHPGLAGNGHSAIWGSLANGQGRAARFFAEHGASMNLEEAAGVGRLDVVQSHFDEHGALKGGATKEQMESGFLYACGYGRTAVVEFLLGKGADPGTRNKRGETGLHWTAYGPHVEVARLLLQHGASVEVQNELQATPLEWTLRMSAHASDVSDRERFHDLVALMIRAGAKLDPNWGEQPWAAAIRSDPHMLAAIRGETIKERPDQ